MKKIIFFVFLILCIGITLTSKAQKAPQLIKSDYKEFRVIDEASFTERIGDVEEQNIEESRIVRLRQISFVSETEFFNQKVQNNGSIIFNKQLDSDLEKVKNHIDQKNPDYDLSKVRIFVLRTHSTNAFATDDGSIYITLGLLGRIETESQLAFVLCHEFSHFIKDHSMAKATEQVKLDYEQGPYGLVQNKKREFSTHGFSKKLELEADALGFELYAQCGYKMNAFEDVFDILSASLLPIVDHEVEVTYPFSEIPFDTSYVPKPNPFDIAEIQDSDDEKSTHPNIVSRKEILNSLFKNEKTKSSKEFITLTETRMSEVRNNAKFTCGEVALYDFNFYGSYCQNQELLEQFEHPDVKVNYFKSWLGLMILKNEKIEDDFLEIYAQYDEPYKLRNVVKETPKYVLNAATVLGSFLLYQQDTNNMGYRDVLYLAADILRKNPRSQPDGLAAYHYLVPKWRALDEEFFSDFLEELDQNNESENEMYEMWQQMDQKWIKRVLAEYNEQRKNTPSHNFKKDGIAFLNPLALHVDENAIAALDPVKSQEMNQYFVGRVSSHFDELGYKVAVVSPLSEHKRDDVSDAIFNSSLIFRQSSLKGKKNEKPAYNLFLNPDKARALSEEYDSRYLAFMGMLAVKDDVKYRGLAIALKSYFLGMSLFAMPQFISQQIVDHEKYMMYVLIYDTKAARFVYLRQDKYDFGLDNGIDKDVFLKYCTHNIISELKYLK